MKNTNNTFEYNDLVVILLLLGSYFFKEVTPISCFICDALEKQISDCPGWDRLPVHSITNLGDKNGFYTHCLDVRLADNTVLHQNIIPYLPTCRSDFLLIWKNSLEKQYKTNVTINCCDYNMCNGPTMSNSATSKKQTVSIALSISILSLVGTWKIFY